MVDNIAREPAAGWKKSRTKIGLFNLRKGNNFLQLKLLHNLCITDDGGIKN